MAAIGHGLRLVEPAVVVHRQRFAEGGRVHGDLGHAGGVVGDDVVLTPAEDVFLGQGVGFGGDAQLVGVGRVLAGRRHLAEARFDHIVGLGPLAQAVVFAGFDVTETDVQFVRGVDVADGQRQVEMLVGAGHDVDLTDHGGLAGLDGRRIGDVDELDVQRHVGLDQIGRRVDGRRTVRLGDGEGGQTEDEQRGDEKNETIPIHWTVSSLP